MLKVVPDMVDGASQPGCIHLSVDLGFGQLRGLPKKSFSDACMQVDVVPSWLRNADVAMPRCSISVCCWSEIMEVCCSVSGGMMQINWLSRASKAVRRDSC
eukprot:jgi/Tetstr1/441515/TSEL_029745.t1